MTKSRRLCAVMAGLALTPVTIIEVAKIIRGWLQETGDEGRA